MIYLIKSTIAFSLLYLLYECWFRRYTFFQSNRIYLLASAVFSLVFPLFSWKANTTHLPVFVLDTVVVGNNVIAKTSEVEEINWLWVVYSIGLGVMLLLFLLKMMRVLKLRSESSGPDAEGVYTLPEQHKEEAFSFFRTIYIGSGIDTEIRSAVLLHERVHVQQLHTVDIIFFELLQCVFWFNPLYRLAEKRLRMLHEFIADHQACGANSVQYTEVLVAHSMGVAPSVLVHSMFNASYLKRRLHMLHKARTRNLFRPTYLMAFLLAGAMIVLSAFSIDPPTPPAPPPPPLPFDVPAPPRFPDVPQVPPAPEIPPFPEVKNAPSLPESTPVPGEVIQPKFPGGEEAMMKFISNEIKYPAEAREEKAQGTVYVEFVIDETGKVKDATIKKGTHHLLDAEALRVINAMPNWTPGTENGKPVSISLIIPIRFSL